MAKRRLVRRDDFTDKHGVLHSTKVYRVAEDDEWQVDFYVDNVKVKDSTYYTNCWMDADATAAQHIVWVRTNNK